MKHFVTPVGVTVRLEARAAFLLPALGAKYDSEDRLQSVDLLHPNQWAH